MNPEATLFLKAAADDYAAARCLLLNWLVAGGLMMGAQAIEKFLKAFILLHKRKAPKHHHLKELLSEAGEISPTLALTRFATMMGEFEKYYDYRYPDNQVSLSGMYSSSIQSLDEFIILLNENMPLLPEIKYRTGLYAALTFSANTGTITPRERWIKNKNHALLPLLPSIEAGYRAHVLGGGNVQENEQR